MSTCSMSPGSAPATWIGPVTKCGPPPGFRVSRAWSRSAGVRAGSGWSDSRPPAGCECRVTVSPDWTVSTGGRAASK